MIDFRYHLVSLVAVFIALAVGIALGAGPLREGISSTLESEVADLRSERADLRAQVDSADRLAEARDSVLRAVDERVVAGTLKGVRVGIVVLHRDEQVLPVDGHVVRDRRTAVAAGVPQPE